MAILRTHEHAVHDAAMGPTTSGEPSTARRPWVVLLYFYVAALIGLGFVITGTTTALFGAKSLVFPQLGIQSYSYESSLRRDPQGKIIATDSERTAARQQTIDDARNDGGDHLVDGAILVLVGLPTLVWHLRRARRAGSAPTQASALEKS
jgi:hypothetical protein